MSLEGQLRQCQSKLAESLRTYEAEVTKQQLGSKELIKTMQKEHESEISQAFQKIENLENKIIEMDISGVSTTPLLIDPPPPPLEPKSPTRKKRRSKKSDPSMPSASNAELHMAPPSKEKGKGTSGSKLSARERLKSSSYGDLTSIDSKEESKSSKTPQISPANTKRKMERKSNRRDSSERVTITSLVAESLSNPSSMLAIRKELKSDAFTPKIQRKFRKHPSAALASVCPPLSNRDGGVASEAMEALNLREKTPSGN